MPHELTLIVVCAPFTGFLEWKNHLFTMECGELDDARTIASYGIAAGATIHAALDTAEAGELLFEIPDMGEACGVAFDCEAQRLYVCNRGQQCVTALDLVAADQSSTPVNVPADKNSAASAARCSADRRGASQAARMCKSSSIAVKTAWIARSSADPAHHSMRWPCSCALNADRSGLFVCCGRDDKVVLLSALDGAVRGEFSAPGMPWGIGVEQSSPTRVWVSACVGNTVQCFDVCEDAADGGISATRRESLDLMVPAEAVGSPAANESRNFAMPTGIAVSGDLVFAAYHTSAAVAAFRAADAALEHVLGNSDAHADRASAPKGAHGVAVDWSAGRLYVCDGSHQPPRVAVYDTGSREFVGAIYPNAAPLCVFVCSQSARVFVSLYTIKSVAVYQAFS